MLWDKVSHFQCCIKLHQSQNKKQGVKCRGVKCPGVKCLGGKRRFTTQTFTLISVFMNIATNNYISKCSEFKQLLNISVFINPMAIVGAQLEQKAQLGQSHVRHNWGIVEGKIWKYHEKVGAQLGNSYIFIYVNLHLLLPILILWSLVLKSTFTWYLVIKYK